MLCMVMSLLLSVTSVSAEDKDYIFVTGYGTLTGYINTLPYIQTSVNKNNDMAKLTYKLEVKDVQGKLIETFSKTSSRGATRINGEGYLGEDGKNLYGAHGVQGGNTYNAGAVYTFTSVDA